jgi:outer membrane receptor protein involved in Fe transport
MQLTSMVLATGTGITIAALGGAAEPVANDAANKNSPPASKSGATAKGSGVENLQIVDPNVVQAQGAVSQVPTAAELPSQTTTAPSAGFGSVVPDASQLPSVQAAQATTPAASTITQNEVPVIPARDVGDLINKADSVTGVETQKRSPIANESRIRGYRLGQIQTWADGAYWFPARLDLDTFLSKVDAGDVKSIVIMKGPYSARYGPGFAFIDIATVGPQFYDGFQVHGRTTFDYKTNGEQLYGRQEVTAGDSYYGLFISYGHRIGNDYGTGGEGIGRVGEIPASYNSRDLNAAFSVKITEDSHFEFAYMRLDQTDLEFPGQAFDTDFLVTNAYRLRYVLENQCYFDQLMVDAFYNRTSMHGDAQHQGKREQIPFLNEIGFVGFTDIDQMSEGYRVAMTWGKPKDLQLTVGTDLRYVTNSLNEFDTLFIGPSNIVGTNVCTGAVNFGIPASHQAVTGGLFAETVIPVNCELTVKGGARVDFVNTNIDHGEAPPGFSSCAAFNSVTNAVLLGIPFSSPLSTTQPDLERDYVLGLGYMTAEYKLNDPLTATAGYGFAMRPPTLTELYSEGSFLAILQQGFVRAFGNPNLQPEKLNQFDVGIRADNGWVRAGLNGFCALVNDYITYRELPMNFGGFILQQQVPQFKQVRFTNTSLATLVGYEGYGEVDVTGYLTPFVTVSYVDGRDQEINEPLPGIAPWEARIGLRFHEDRKNPRWGTEIFARWVENQDRVATSLGEVTSAGFTVWNLRAYWQAREGILLTAGVENLFDKYYREHLDLLTGRGVYQPGISGYVGVELRY